MVLHAFLVEEISKTNGQHSRRSSTAENAMMMKMIYLASLPILYGNEFTSAPDTPKKAADDCKMWSIFLAT